MLVLDVYWDEVDTNYSSTYNCLLTCLNQYNYKLPIGLTIESLYLIWKSEQHIKTPKYYILN